MQKVVSERSNFLIDLYIAEALCKERGFELQLVEPEEIDTELTHVNDRTGAMHDMAGLTARAHAAGAVTIWDLAHSAGAVPGMWVLKTSGMPLNTCARCWRPMSGCARSSIKNMPPPENI